MTHTGSSGPTLQQQQLETQQATTAANLNLEENEQRKSILNAMLGTRVFRGSALSRATRGNTPGTGGENQQTGPSRTQVRVGRTSPVVKQQANLLTSSRDQTAAAATAAAVAAGGGIPTGGFGGTGGGGRVGAQR